MLITWNRNGIVHLDYWSIKIFSLFGGFCPLWFLSFGAFVLWCFCPLWLFSVRPRDRMTRMLIVYTCIIWSHEQKWGSYTLIVIILKIFSLLGVLSTLIFILWGFCPIVLLSIVAFSLSTPRDRMTRMLIVHTCIMWSHEQKWDRTPWLLEFQNIFSFGCFVRFDFYPLDLLSYGAFVHFGFSLSTHVIAWRECWLSTPVSCDHMNRNGIVHLDCWSIKIFSLLVVLSALILSFVPFVLWCFCPFWLFSVRPHDRMTRMLIVHTCIMWSHVQKKFDRTPWLL